VARAPASRIGIVGDIHGEHQLLDLAVDHFVRNEVDTILAVGDIVDGRGDVDACCELLVRSGAIAVRGNHERWFLAGDMRHLPDATPADGVSAKSRAVLAALPATQRLETVRGTLLLCHGMDDDDMSTVRPDDEGYALEANDPLQRLIRSREVAMVVAGHSHCRMVRRFGALTVINAGTLLAHHKPCFGVIDLPHANVTFFEPAAGEVVTADVFTLAGLPAHPRN